MSDLLVRFAVVVTPLLIAGFAAMLGVHFQRQAQIFADGGVPTFGSYVNPIRDIIAYMSVVGIDGLVALSLWSGLVVTNTCRVCRSLRTPWFAAIGWLIAPGLGLIAHLTVDNHFQSGSLIGFAVFLAALYVPFGTLGGVAHDLGGSAHLARTWYLASVVSAFLLIVGMSGSTSGVPTGDPVQTLRIRAFACYLGALMLVASSALVFATGRNLHAMISHRWHKETNPDRMYGGNRLKIKRRGRQLRRRLTPTLFLRVIVTAGIVAVGVASVVAMLALRGRALRLDGPFEYAERASLLDDYRDVAVAIGVVAAAVHAVYVLWAVVAVRNAHRRSILTPTPWAVVAAFLTGPIVCGVGVKIAGPFGAAVLTVGVLMTIGGFIIGQLVLGRTVSALGGQGRIFLGWLLIDVCMGVFTAFVASRSDTRLQVVADGVVQTGFTLVSAAVAWTAMARLDQTIRDYRNSGVLEAVALPAAQPAESPVLTSSHS